LRTPSKCGKRSFVKRSVGSPSVDLGKRPSEPNTYFADGLAGVRGMCHSFWRRSGTHCVPVWHDHWTSDNLIAFRLERSPPKWLIDRATTG